MKVETGFVELPPPERFYRLREVAEMLSVSLPTVEKMIREGKIEAVDHPDIHGKRITHTEYTRFANKRYGDSNGI